MSSMGSFTTILAQANQLEESATVFGHRVSDPQRFGVVGFDEQGRALTKEEKPPRPLSNYAVTGLFFYDQHAVEIAKSIKPSSRDELEITAINQAYLDMRALNVELLGRGFAWLDTGTHESLLEATHSVETIEKRQRQKIACLEEIAFSKGWLEHSALHLSADRFNKNSYGDYLRELVAVEESVSRENR